MNIRHSVFPILFLILCCGSSEQTKYFEKVMKIHDEVMPKTSDISKLSRFFEDQIKNQKLDSSQKIQVNKMLFQLEEAHESMMVWMNKFNVPDEKNEAIEYLKAEEQSITTVRNAMLTAISEANDLKNTSK
jgi:uncharacterized lipoprotein YehR (DUF1307 family)